MNKNVKQTPFTKQKQQKFADLDMLKMCIYKEVCEVVCFWIVNKVSAMHSDKYIAASSLLFLQRRIVNRQIEENSHTIM